MSLYRRICESYSGGIFTVLFFHKFQHEQRPEWKQLFVIAVNCRKPQVTAGADRVLCAHFAHIAAGNRRFHQTFEVTAE